MLFIAICDDEQYMLEALKKLVNGFFVKNNTDIVIMPFASGEQLLQYENRIDILFLDIQMKNMDGMETAKKLRQSDFKGFLIFVTILKEWVFQAFEVQAFDYLLKPIEEESFTKTMYRLLDCMRNAKDHNLLIRTGYESRLVPVDDIVFCEVMDRKIYLHLTTSEVIDLYEKIENLEQRLNKCFYRCHRSFLIHLKYVRSYSTDLIVYVLLLSVSGFFVCQIRNTSILYAVMIAEIMQFMFGIVHSILCLVYPLAVAFDQEMVGMIFMVLGYLPLPAMAVCCYAAGKFFSYDEIADNQYALVMLAPTLMILLIGEYINSTIYGNTIVTNSSGEIMNADHSQMLMIQLLGMASLFCILRSYKKLLENFHLSTRLSLLEQEELSLNQYVTEAKNRYEKTMSFRHDIKNHIAVLRKLLQEENIEQAVNYMRDMEEITEELSFSYNTNHPIANILIGNKLGAAKNIGIDVACSLSLPYPCLIRDIDFAIILSNALDNAINACKNMDDQMEKYIYVAGKRQGDFILLEIENSCQTGVFQKGTGLLNIQTVAEKYHGAVDIKIQEHSFRLSVLLIIPYNSSDGFHVTIPPHSDSISQQIG